MSLLAIAYSEGLIGWEGTDGFHESGCKQFCIDDFCTM